MQSSPDLTSIGEALGALLRPGISDEEAMVYAGGRLAVDIANATDADLSDVWKVMTHLPDGYLRLLESPEGWAALSSMVSATMGGDGNLLNPSIH